MPARDGSGLSIGKPKSFPFAGADHRSDKRSAILFQEFQSVFKLRSRSQEPVLAEDGILRIAERHLIILAHYNRFFRTDLFAEAAEDASQHIYLKEFGVSFFIELGLGRLHLDGE